MKTKPGFLLFIVSFLTLCLPHSVAFSKGEESNLPLSREAKFIETYNTSEWTLHATGIAGGPEKDRQERAMLDARKAALWYILYGEDGLVQTAEERAKIKLCEEKLFEANTVLGFITYLKSVPIRRILIEKGKKLKVVVELRINREMVRKWLIDTCGFLPPPEYQPTIMVFPKVKKGENPISLLYNDPHNVQGSAVIESHLTSSGKFKDVLVPSQEMQLQQIKEAMNVVKDVKDDYAYMIALNIGSDLYITFSIDFVSKKVGSTVTKKCEVTVRAYETTTSRLLGSETGYSQYRSASEGSLIEEAIKDAIDRVITRIFTYWKDDLKRGYQYRLLFDVVCEDFDEDELEDLSFCVADILEEISDHTKEVVLTDQTYDFRVWARPRTAKHLRDIYTKAKKRFRDEFPQAKFHKTVFNIKFAIIQLQCAD